jgi:hypothetical protein
MTRGHPKKDKTPENEYLYWILIPIITRISTEVLQKPCNPGLLSKRKNLFLSIEMCDFVKFVILTLTRS